MSRKFFTPPQPSPNSRGGSKKFTNDLGSLYIEDKYDVRFKSNQSYYTLLDEAKISWKKTQKSNPKKNDELVKTKKIEIEKILAENR